MGLDIVFFLFFLFFSTPSSSSLFSLIISCSLLSVIPLPHHRSIIHAPIILVHKKFISDVHVSSLFFLAYY